MMVINGRMVNSRRKRFCDELHKGQTIDNNGKAIKLTARQKTWRAGYVSGVNDSNAAVKNSVGLNQNERVPEGKKITHNLSNIRKAANANIPATKIKTNGFDKL